MVSTRGKENKEADEEEEEEETVVLDGDVLDLVVEEPRPPPPPLIPHSSASSERLTGMLAALLWENRREDRRSTYSSVETDAASVVELLSRTDRDRSVSDAFRGDDIGAAILEMSWKYHPVCGPVFSIAEEGAADDADVDEDVQEGKKDDEEAVSRRRARDVTSTFLDKVRELRSTDKRGHDDTDAALGRLWASTSPLLSSSSSSSSAARDKGEGEDAGFEWSVPYAADLVGRNRNDVVAPFRVLPVTMTRMAAGRRQQQGDRVSSSAPSGISVLRTGIRSPAMVLTSSVTSSTFDPEKYVVMLRGISRGNEVELHFPGSTRLFEPEFQSETVKGVVVAQYASPEQPLVVEVPPSRTIVKVDLSSAEAAMKGGVFVYPPGYDSGPRYGRSAAAALDTVVRFSPFASPSDFVWVRDAVCPEATDVLASHGPEVFRAVYNIRQARSLGCRVGDIWDDRRASALERVAHLVRRLVHENVENYLETPTTTVERGQEGDALSLPSAEEWLRTAMITSRSEAKAALLESLFPVVVVDGPKVMRAKKGAKKGGGAAGAAGVAGESHDSDDDSSDCDSDSAALATCEPCAEHVDRSDGCCVFRTMNEMLVRRSFRGVSDKKRSANADAKKRKGVRSIEFAGASPLTAFTYSEISVGYLGKGFLLDRARPADVECLRAKRAAVRSALSAATKESKEREVLAVAHAPHAAHTMRQGVRAVRTESGIRDVVRIWPVAKMSKSGVIGGTMEVDSERTREVILRRVDVQETKRDAWIVDDVFRYSPVNDAIRGAAAVPEAEDASSSSSSSAAVGRAEQADDDVDYITDMFLDGERRAILSATTAVGNDVSTGVAAALSALLHANRAEWARRNHDRLVALVEVLNPPENVRDQVSGQMSALRAKEPEIRRKFQGATRDFTRFREKLVNRIVEHAALVHRRHTLVFLGALLLEVVPEYIQVREAALNSCPAPQAPLLASPSEPRDQTFVRCVLADLTNAKGDDDEVGLARMEDMRRKVASMLTPQVTHGLKEQDDASTPPPPTTPPRLQNDVRWTGYLPPSREIRSSSSPPSLLSILDVSVADQASAQDQQMKTSFADRSKQWARFSCCQDALDAGFYYYRGLTETTPELSRILGDTSRTPGFGGDALSSTKLTRIYDEDDKERLEREASEQAVSRQSFLQNYSGIAEDASPSLSLPVASVRPSLSTAQDDHVLDDHKKVVMRLLAANPELKNDVWLNGVVRSTSTSSTDEQSGGNTGTLTQTRRLRRTLRNKWKGAGGVNSATTTIASASMVLRRASEMWKEISESLLEPGAGQRLWDNVLDPSSSSPSDVGAKVRRAAIVRFVNSSLRPSMRFLSRPGELKMGAGRSALSAELSVIKTEAAQTEGLVPVAGGVIYALVGDVTNGMDVLAVVGGYDDRDAIVFGAVTTYMFVLSLHRVLRDYEGLWVRSGGGDAPEKDVDAQKRSQRVTALAVRTLCSSLERAVEFGTQDLRSVESKVEKQREKEKQRKMALVEGLGEEERAILREYKKVRSVSEVERFIVQRLRKGSLPPPPNAEEGAGLGDDDREDVAYEEGYGVGNVVEDDPTGGYDDESFAFPDRED